MGEIIYSLAIGALLVVTGIAMNAVLRQEEKRVCQENTEANIADGETDSRRLFGSLFPYCEECY